MTETILDRIKAYKLEEIAADKAAKPIDELEAEARNSAHPRPFSDALIKASRDGYGLIAEIKKASPSKGLIREDFDPAELAKAYELGGATCLSVLTDTPSFQGAKDFIPQVRAAVDLPILRKDFMYDPYQVVEARAMGADCILIIMASVSDAQAAELSDAAKEWGLDVLVEVHNREEMDRTMPLSPSMVGINNRDLHTFETTLDTSIDLRDTIPADRLVVSESGIHTPADLARLADVGFGAFLIGESFMREPDPGAALATLLDPAG